MSDVAINVEGVGKQYHIGRARAQQKTLRESVVGLATAPFRRRDGAAASQTAFWALREIGFQVRSGEVLGIIGRNGAGKSTLLKILSRITEPTEGRIEIYGRVGSLLEVGTGFHQELTGRENIYLNGAILGMKRAEITRKFDEIVAFSEVEKFLDTPVKHYSSGMYMRLAFAVAAHLEPEILIVDEVLAVGDAAFQQKCLGKMGQFAGEGRTVLFVSHNMGAIQSLTTRCCLLKAGRIEALGPTEGVIASYFDSDASTISADLTTRVRPDWLPKGPRRLDITGINILSEGGEVVCNQPLRIQIAYRANRACDQVGFEVNVSLPSGVRLITCASEDCGKLYTMAENTTGQAVLSIDPFSLAAGRYMMGVGAASGGQTLDYHDAALTLDVKPDPGDSFSMVRSLVQLGVRLHSIWD